jgi:hypothetical protein
MEAGTAVTVMLGPGSTDKVALAEFVQVPFAAITVYCVVMVGLAETKLPTRPPGFQVYELAPRAEAKRLAVPPIQIMVGVTTVMNYRINCRGGWVHNSD